MLRQAEKALKDYFGFSEFRPHQKMLIERVLAGRDVLGVMPTGAGKSLVYQIPALVAGGTVIVVSPLISLMKDQVDALRQAGINAECLNSSLSTYEQSEVLSATEKGNYQLLYVAPERLEDPRFLATCRKLTIPLLAVDEAHCVSQWGKDFRPSYVGIAAFVKQLPTRPCVCALTATATIDVREDIMRALELQDPFVCVSGFNRANLYFGVERPEPSKKKACLLRLLQGRKQQSGIVYCSTRKAVDEVYELLNDHGYQASRYHAGLADLVRKRNQEDFLFDRTPIMVATNAFGMGIDKSNVSFVIHYNMARDVESYYQEAGRAGRDGSPADCILIYNKKDVQTANYFVELGQEERLAQGMAAALSDQLYKRDADRVRRMTAYCTTSDCLRSYILKYFGERDAAFRCEHCSSCKAENEIIDATIEAQKIISCVMRLEQRGRVIGRNAVIDILRGSESQKILQPGFDSLSTYGIMEETPKHLIHQVMDALVAEGQLAISEGKYPVVSCTPEGREFITERARFSIKVAKEPPKKEAPIKAGMGNSTGSSPTGKTRKASTNFAEVDIDDNLFERLKALRREKANEQKTASFIVFHDSTLRDMCVKLPRSEAEFLEVSGVGKLKAERYAEDFLACIEDYLSQEPSTSA